MSLLAWALAMLGCAFLFVLLENVFLLIEDPLCAQLLEIALTSK